MKLVLLLISLVTMAAQTSLAASYQPPGVGPWRELAPLTGLGDLREVIDSLNDILSDKWLEFAVPRSKTCDAPCAEVSGAAAVSLTVDGVQALECTSLRAAVARSRASWREAREKGFILGEALGQAYEQESEEAMAAAMAAHADFQQAMAATRSILPAYTLVPVVEMDFSWRLSRQELLPGLPEAWVALGAGFQASPDQYPVEVRTGDEFVQVTAERQMTPAEYCAGDTSIRVEGLATFLTKATAPNLGSLEIPLPLTTMVVMHSGAEVTAGESQTVLPGDL